jgi:alkylhydroperoxidase family enzyme
MNAPPPRLTVESEPLIPYVPDADVINRLRATVEPYMKRMGFLPNALKLYAHRPEIAETLFRLNSNIMRDPSSTLDQFLKRKLSAVASRTNGCTYCTAHCCSMLIRGSGMGPEGWGLNESEVHDLLSGDYEPKDELERVAIDFVVAASTDPSNVPEEILERLKQHLTPPQIVELACVVGFWKFYNTVHDSLHIPLESSLLGDSGWVDVGAPGELDR